MAILATVFDPNTLFAPAFAQRSLLAVVLIAALSAALGTTVVLRDLPFFAHAVGAGAYPALVLGIAAGVSLAIAAPLGAITFALLLWLGDRDGAHADGRDARTGLLVAQALAGGAILTGVVASDRLLLASPPEALLFGSILTVDVPALIGLAITTALLLALAAAFSSRWIAAGFDRGAARQVASGRVELLMLGAIALAVAATLPVTGSLLAGSMLVIPAATARVFSGSVAGVSIGAAAVALVSGVTGLYLALAFDLPAGAAIAAVACTVFVVVAGGSAVLRATGQRRRRGGAIAISASLVASSLAIGGCGDATPARDTKATPLVVATTPAVADVVKNVGGNSILVTTLLRPGTDPHEYEPTPSDVRALASARVVFKSGGDLDGWLDRAARAANSDRTPVDLSQSGILLPAGGGSPATAFNAHWFLDPRNVEAAARRVRDELIKAYPIGRETYRANAGAYISRVRKTDLRLEACIVRSRARPVIVTGHDDFAYLAQRYRIAVAAELSRSGESEPSLADARAAATRAREQGAHAFVAGAGEAGGLEREFAKRIDAPLLELYADSLAQAGEASTLLGAISYDVERIVGAASKGSAKCPAPAT